MLKRHVLDKHPLLNAARDFETGLIERSRNSERKAWRVAGASTLLTLLLASGYALLLPLKEQVPYLVLADPAHGTSSVARIDMPLAAVSASEALNKSQVAHFVIARESYDWDLLNRRDSRLVQAMASGAVLREYAALYSNGHPDNPDTLYGREQSVRIRILSTVLTWNDGGADDAASKLPRTPIAASVRFERWLFDKASGQSRLLDTRLATLKIGYDPELEMNEEARIENPLGFRVLAYRVDQDSLSSQPAAASATAPEGERDAIH